MLFVCVSTQRKRTGRQAAEALTSQQSSLGVAVRGAIPIFFFLLFWIFPQIFTANIYYFRNRDNGYALFYCRFSSEAQRGEPELCVRCHHRRKTTNRTGESDGIWSRHVGRSRGQICFKTRSFCPQAFHHPSHELTPGPGDLELLGLLC